MCFSEYLSEIYLKYKKRMKSFVPDTIRPWKSLGLAVRKDTCEQI